MRRSFSSFSSRCIAVGLLAAAVGCTGVSPDERLSRAREAHQAGDLSAAIVDLKVVLQSAPDNVEARLLLGDATMRVGDVATAEKEFARAVELLDADDERAYQARLGLAMAQSSLQQFEAAQASTALLLEARPDDLFARMLAVQSAYALGEDDTARAHLELVLDSRPDDPLAKMLLGLVSVRQGRNDEGERLLEETLALRPDDNSVRLTLARVKALLGKPVESLRTLTPVLESAPDDPVIVQLFESIDFRDDDIADRAVAFADELAAASPDSFVPSLIQARASFVRRDFDTAADFYDLSASMGAGRFAVLGSFLANRARGDSAASLAKLEGWLEANPDDVVVRNILATMHLGGGEQVAAAEQYERMLEQGGRDPAVLNNLAWLYGELGDSRAVGLAREAHRIAPQNGAITDTLGWLLVQQGDHTEGILLLRQAVAQAPQVPAIRQHLATALSEAGQEAEAARVLAEIVPVPGTDVPNPAE